MHKVLIVGLGSIGAMAAWQLSQRPGVEVLGVEAGPEVNPGASYAGESRLFRTAVKEGPVFNAHAEASLALWEQLEQTSSREILINCGALSIGPENFDSMLRTAEVIDTYDIPHQVLTGSELRRRFPQFSYRDDDVGILDIRGGGLRPEVAVSAALDAAAAQGAKLYFNTPVTGISQTSTGVEVSTAGQVFMADQVIVTAGSWTPMLLPWLAEYVRVHPIGLTWFMPRNIGEFTPDVFPVFMRDQVVDGEHTHWFGAPSLDGYSFKVGVYPEPWRVVGTRPESWTYAPEQLQWIGERVQRCFPNILASPVRFSTHHDSFASHQIPIFDRLDKVVFATGMHGNAFKFAPSYGRMLAEMVLGDSDMWRDEFSLTSHEKSFPHK